MTKKPQAKKRVGRDSDQFIVRMPDGMRAALSEISERSGRSMNAEIVHALALHFAEEGMSTDERLKMRLRVKIEVALKDVIRDAVEQEIKAWRFDSPLGEAPVAPHATKAK